MGVKKEVWPLFINNIKWCNLHLLNNAGTKVLSKLNLYAVFLAFQIQLELAHLVIGRIDS